MFPSTPIPKILDDLLLSPADFSGEYLQTTFAYMVSKFPDIEVDQKMKYPFPEQILKEAIEICEMPALEGELKQSSTSFVHSAVSLLQLLTPELETKTSNPNFTVGDGIQLVPKSDVVCHKLNYVYAVYLCHSMETTHIKGYIILKPQTPGI
ncbi:hypothetical protein V6N13_065884 [Hibiscus sabdariffa]|uniref:Uncharacterized protein n=2 Tax=Hibiscus sabdariffa TaxID=183260 RepID=A0ABR2BHY7_9ROSI